MPEQPAPTATALRAPLPLTGKTALVTGGSRGIGRAIAERLAADGALVGLTYAKEAGAAADAVAGIRDKGGRAFALPAELGVPGDADTLWARWDEAAAEHAADGSTGLDILVNNAAVGRSADIASLTPEEFDTLFAVNVKAPFFVVQQALPRLRDGGRIVNISSGVTRIAMPEIIGYTATKGALEVFTRQLAAALGPRGITVNAVSPGIIDTDVNAAWLRADQAAWDAAASRAALGRVGRAEDVADVVAFLASDDSRWVTASVLDATGGSDL